MADVLYESDVLIWSEQQAQLLQRLARGELVNGIDWDHVVEEIADVGLLELNACRSNLRQMLVHLIKITSWPDNTAVPHWSQETVAFQTEAQQHFSPSMRQRIDVAVVFGQALRQLSVLTIDGQSPKPLPTTCPVTLDDLLIQELPALLERFQA